MKKILFILIYCTGIIQCWSQHSYLTVDTDSSLFSLPEQIGTIESDSILEASGLATSIANDGAFWTHNDSGDKPRMFLMDKDGKWLATYYLKNAVNNDWEDVAVGPGPQKGKSYVYVAGMIVSDRPEFAYGRIYRFDEPKVKKGQAPKVSMLTEFSEIKFKYPEPATNATYENRPEFFIANDRKNDIFQEYYIFPKEKNKGVYYQKLDAQNGQIQTTELFNVSFPYYLTKSAYFSKERIYIEALDGKAYIWNRKPGELASELLQNKPHEIKPIQNVLNYGETLLIDPLTKDLYIVSSRDDDLNLYRLVYPYATDKINQLQLMGQLFKPTVRWETNGGDISADGQEILIKTRYPEGVYYWKRQGNEPIYETLLKRAPKKLPYIDEQKGEAITFSRDSSGYYTTSEGKNQPIFFYERKNKQ